MERPDLLALLSFSLGPLHIGPTVLGTWLVMAALVAPTWLLARRLAGSRRGLGATAIEAIVLAMHDAVAEVAPRHADRLLPFIGTLWLFVALSNLLGLVPGLVSPTGDLSLTAGLALLVFVSVHWFGIRVNGWRSYLRHYLEPSPILLPFHVIGEITRTLALAVRLFGNIMSLELAALLILMVAGLLAPVPLLVLHVVEALVQAYIFGILALVYVAGALQSQDLHREGGADG